MATWNIVIVGNKDIFPSWLLSRWKINHSQTYQENKSRHEGGNNTSYNWLKAHFTWNSKLMLCVWLMISSCNIGGICQIVMNNADNSLSKAFLWNIVPWDLAEFSGWGTFPKCLCRRWCIQAVMIDVSMRWSGGMRCSCGIEKDASAVSLLPVGKFIPHEKDKWVSR